MIFKIYYIIWHDLLKLPEPISWIIVHSVRDHLFAWDLAGSLIVTTLWVLLMHFIAML